MEKAPAKLELRLLIQSNIPIENVSQGEDFYTALKFLITEFNSRAMINGQITKHLEPCCGPPRKEDQNAKDPKIPE